jgi:hypothetical protein
MINKICFTADWLNQKRKELRADPYLLERALHAFALLGHLAESGLDFVFKGGTSLLLHVPVIRRLSIDIDILCSAPAETLEKILAEVAKVEPFIRYEEDERGARGLPLRRHFKFYYNPVLGGNPAPFVILDVVEESDVPHEVVSKLITPELLHIEREIAVTVPTIESLLADKLTAFAPRTIGVPLIPPHDRDADTMQIIKQLFDVGELFDLAEDLSCVRRVYQRVFNQENEYRGGGFTHVQALDDTLDALDAALHLSRHGLKGWDNTSEAEKMADGVRKLSGHLVNHRFNLDVAKIAAAKAALLSRLILVDGDNSLTHWRTLPDIKVIGSLVIDGPWKQLQRLRNTSPQAFFYWHQAARLQLKIEGNL